MTGLVWSIVLAAVGIFGLWLAGRKDWRGWAVGLAAQVLWFSYAVITQQYGFIASAVAYGVVYGRNWWLWRHPEPSSKETALKVYICGPMAGRPNLNREAFERAAAVIRARGDEPVIPHDLLVSHPVREHDGDCVPLYGYRATLPDGTLGHDGGCYVRNDLSVMVLCDSIYRLHDWGTSTGAGIETRVADLLRMPIETEPE